MKLLSPLALFTACTLLAAPLLANAAPAPQPACQAGQHCVDQARKAKETRVLDAKRDVSKRQSDLDKAMKKGDAKHIDNRKERLAQSRKNLNQAIDDLDHHQ